MVILVLLFCTIILSGCQANNPSITNNLLEKENRNITTTPSEAPIFSNEDYKYVFINTVKGKIKIRLYQKLTPNTVANFLEKSNNGFYNNLTFHRVEPDFVVQGGDPLGNGTGGGNIESELNNQPFKRGSVGLARTPISKEVSNDSQFYICLNTNTCDQLTGDYVNFGEVVEGMEIVDQIKVGDKILDIKVQ